MGALVIGIICCFKQTMPCQAPRSAAEPISPTLCLQEMFHAIFLPCINHLVFT